MIKITDLEKIYRTEEVETVALNKLSFEVRRRRVCSRDGAFRLRKINPPQYCRITG